VGNKQGDKIIRIGCNIVDTIVCSKMFKTKIQIIKHKKLQYEDGEKNIRFRTIPLYSYTTVCQHLTTIISHSVLTTVRIRT
jgi:hypothetical protein